jgi:hypothetical protein
MASYERLLPILLTLLALFGTATAGGQVPAPSIPPGAQIIETKDISGIVGKKRQLVLWMTDAVKVHEPYEYCGTSVYGDYWQGTGALSVVDAESREVISTIGLNRIQLPFYVGDFYYYVPRADQQHKGMPELLHLSDITGEGLPLQFLVFDYEACGIASAQVFGYRATTDKVVQYQIEVVEGPSRHKESSVDNIFNHEPVRPGYWNFRWQPGHGSDDTYHEIVRFDPKRQLFVDRHITIKGRF